MHKAWFTCALQVLCICCTDMIYLSVSCCLNWHDLLVLCTNALCFALIRFTCALPAAHNVDWNLCAVVCMPPVTERLCSWAAFWGSNIYLFCVLCCRRSSVWTTTGELLCAESKFLLCLCTRQLYSCANSEEARQIPITSAICLEVVLEDMHHCRAGATLLILGETESNRP